MQRYPYTDLVMVAALLVYIWTAFKVTWARSRHQVVAPATDGPPEFQRIFRVQVNTLEQMILFLPSLWLFASAWGDFKAAFIGVFWPIGRVIYAIGYTAAAEKRGPGFGIAFLVSVILLLGGLVGTVMNMMQ